MCLRRPLEPGFAAGACDFRLHARSFLTAAMRTRRLSIVTVTYNTVLTGFSLTEGAREAFSTYEVMKRRGIDLNKLSTEDSYAAEIPQSLCSHIAIPLVSESLAVFTWWTHCSLGLFTDSPSATRFCGVVDLFGHRRACQHVSPHQVGLWAHGFLIQSSVQHLDFGCSASCLHGGGTWWACFFFRTVRQPAHPPFCESYWAQAVHFDIVIQPSI